MIICESEGRVFVSIVRCPAFKSLQTPRAITSNSTATNKTILINDKINGNRSSMASHSGIRIISEKKMALTRIHNLIRITQRGLCWQCGTRIEVQHNIVSRGKTRRFYYHKECAEKLNIIWLSIYMHFLARWKIAQGLYCVLALLKHIITIDS